MILVIALIAVLAGSLALLAALHTRAFIALALADLRQNAGLGAASLESLQSAVQALAFLDMDLGHLCFPSLRCTRLFPECSLRVIDMTNVGIILKNRRLVNILFRFFAEIFVCKSKCNPTIAFSLTNLNVAFTHTNAGVGFITHRKIRTPESKFDSGVLVFIRTARPVFLGASLPLRRAERRAAGSCV